MNDEQRRLLCRELVEQAKCCETTGGAAMLLAIKTHLEGSPDQIFTDMEHLWQVADHLANLGANVR